MSKLHELLAVEKDIKTTAEKIIKETSKTFKDKQGHFEGMERVYDPINADDREVLDSEKKQIVTTVPEKLDYFSSQIAKLFDVIYQKESTNTQAVADLIFMDGKKSVEVAKNIPVTILVQMEKILEGIRNQVYNAIPTLTPSKPWVEDSGQKNIFKTDQTRKLRTKKVPRAFVRAAATKEHPAQVDIISEDIPAGYWLHKEWSGMVTSAQKSDIMSRLDLVISSVKKARARANNIDVVKGNIGHKIFTFINKG